MNMLTALSIMRVSKRHWVKQAKLIIIFFNEYEPNKY